jgi:hypothetical protein
VYVEISDFSRGRLSLDERAAGFKQQGVHVGFGTYYDIFQFRLDKPHPPGRMRRLLEKVPWAASYEMESVDAEGAGNFGVSGRLYWAYSQLTWDPSADIDALLEDYVKTAFGSAAGAMRRYYNRLDNETLTDRVWAMAFRDLRDAMTDAGSKEQVKERIRHVLYYTYFAHRWIGQVKGGFASADEAVAAYRFIHRISSQFIISFPYQEGLVRSALLSFGLTNEEVDALRDTTPFSGAEANEILQAALSNWAGDTFYEAPYVIGSWNFDEGAGATAADGSGAGATVNLKNGVSWTPGVRGHAITFDGLDDLATMPATVLEGHGETTMTFWLRLPMARAGAVIADRQGKLPFAGVKRGDTFSFHTGVRTNAIDWLYPAISDSGWHHYVITRDIARKQSTLYIDGVSQGTRSYDEFKVLDILSDQLVLGQWPTGATGAFDAKKALLGSIDEFRVYGGILTSADATALFIGQNVAPGRASLP